MQHLLLRIQVFFLVFLVRQVSSSVYNRVYYTFQLRQMVMEHCVCARVCYLYVGKVRRLSFFFMRESRNGILFCTVFSSLCYLYVLRILLIYLSLQPHCKKVVEVFDLQETFQLCRDDCHFQRLSTKSVSMTGDNCQCSFCFLVEVIVVYKIDRGQTVFCQFHDVLRLFVCSFIIWSASKIGVLVKSEITLKLTGYLKKRW